MKFVLCSTLSLLLLGAQAYGQVAGPEVNSSRKAFRRLMKNPLTQDYFTYLQQDLIPTRLDTRMRNFFRHDGVMSELYQFHVDNEDHNLDEFIDEAESQMMRVRKDMGSEHSRKLYRMVVELAQSLGFSDKALENISIFVADGSKNAFTVSASKNRIIIVFQSALLDSMPLSEVRAIVGHELGHIVLGHSTQRRLNMFMVNLLQSIFSQSGEGQLSTQTQLKTNFSEHFCGTNCMLKRIDGTSPVMNMVAGPTEMSLHRAEMQVFMGLKEHPQVRNAMLVKYLNLGLEAMNDYLASESSISLVQSYRDDLVSSLENPKHFIRGTNSQEFVRAMTEMLNAISRSQETSSDRISNSVVKNEYLASSFIRLLGLGNFDFKNRSALVKQMVQQGEGMLNKNDRAGLVERIGTTHPSTVLRIYLISQLPSYPAVVIANPFTKLLALNQYVLMEKTLAQIASSQPAPADAKAARQQKAMFDAHLAQIDQVSEEIFTEILALVKERSIVHKNPQLSNLVHYSLVHREQQLSIIQELKEKIAQSTDKSVNEQLGQRLQMMESVFLHQSDEFFARIIKALSEQTSEVSELKTLRLEALKVAAQSVSLEEVRQMRKKVQIGDPSRRWPQNPMDGLKAPNFIVPRAIQPQVRQQSEPQGASPSFMRMLRCEGILRGE